MEEEKRKGGLVADLGNTIDKHFAQPGGDKLSCSPQKTSREAAGLALWTRPWAAREHRWQRRNFSQMAEVLLQLEGEERLAETVEAQQPA